MSDARSVAEQPPVSIEWRISVAGDSVRARVDAGGAGPGRTVFVCAHGAGGHMGDRSMERLTAMLVPRGLDLVRFNFLYRERGSGRPDPMPRLQDCVSQVVDRVRAELAPRLLIVGGRSMGGRAASMMAATGFACDGLLLLAYPLHPAGKPEQRRDAHLPAIRVPTLCLNGTRDELCRRDLMERALTTVAPVWTMHWLEGADHGFHVLKRSGRTDDDVLVEVGDAVGSWMATVAGN